MRPAGRSVQSARPAGRARPRSRSTRDPDRLLGAGPGGGGVLLTEVLDRGGEAVAKRHARPEVEEPLEARRVTAAARLPLGPPGLELDALAGAGQLRDLAGDVAYGGLLVGPEVGRFGVPGPLAQTQEAVDEVEDVEERAALAAGAPDPQHVG